MEVRLCPHREYVDLESGISENPELKVVMGDTPLPGAWPKAWMITLFQPIEGIEGLEPIGSLESIRTWNTVKPVIMFKLPH